LDREEEVISAFETAIEHDAETEFARLSHLDLAALYEKNGDTEQAEIHRAAAAQISESKTMSAQRAYTVSVLDFPN
jgi:hypothetical protein